NSDIKFVIRSAEFQTGVVGNAVFRNKSIAPTLLAPNSLVSVDSSNVMTVKHKNHGLIPGALTEITGVIASPYAALADVNKIHTVATVIDNNTYTVVVDSNATTTGTFGGDAVYS